MFVCAYSSSLFTITIRTQSLYAIEKDRKQNNLSSAANQMVLLICTALAAAGKHTMHPQNSAGLCRCPIGVCLHLRVKYWPTKSKAAFFQHVHFSWLLSQAVWEKMPFIWSLTNVNEFLELVVEGPSISRVQCLTYSNIV